MLRVCFDCYGVYTTDSVYQWDLNRKLSIAGLNYDSAPTIHFSNKKSTEALVVQSTIKGGVIYCDVPNILLKEPYDIVGYICSSLNQEITTYETIRIPVKTRIKPADYIYNDNVEILTYYSLMSEITSVKASTEKDLNNMDASKASKIELNAVKSEMKNTIDIEISNVERDITKVENEIASERARIDELIQLTPGSTTGDAELQDIRVDVHGTTHNSAGTAVREQIRTLDSKIDNNVSTLSSEIENLDLNNYQYRISWQKAYIDLSGNIIENGVYRTSELLYIPAQTKIEFDAVCSNTVAFVAVYNSDGTFRQIYQRGYADTTRYYHIEYYAFVDTYVRFCTRSLDNSIEPCDIMNMKKSKLNYENRSVITNTRNGYIKADGTLNSASNQVYYRTNAFFLHEGEKVKVNGVASPSVALLAEVDQDTITTKNVLVVGDDKYRYFVYEADRPMWLVLSSRMNYSVNSGKEERNVNVPFGTIKNKMIAFYDYPNTLLKGKKILAFGDSLMAGYSYGKEASWVNRLAVDYGMEVVNEAISGTPIATPNETWTSNAINQVVSAKMTDCDYVTFIGGANDYNENIVIGEPYSQNTAEFCGGLNSIFTAILGVNPKAKILPLTNYRRYWSRVNSVGHSDKDYVDAFIAVCERYACPCFNNWENSTFFPQNEFLAEWQDEGLVIKGVANQHISAEMYEILEEKYKTALLSL